MKSIKFLDKNWVLLFISLLLGGIAAWAVGQYLKVKEGEIQQQYSRTDIVKVPVVVAVGPLSKGDLLTPDKAVVREIPQDYVPDDAIHPNDFGLIANKMVLNDVQPGKPILLSYVPKSGEEQFSDILKPGRRAVTININENNSNANMLMPGDYIDLYLSQKQSDKSLHLILERVTVLATGRQSISEKDKLKKSIFGETEAYSTVTLDLSTMDAGRVSLAQEYGSFVALLRNRKDELKVSSTLIKEADVFLHNEREHQVEYIIGGNGGIAQGVTRENKIENPVSQFKTFANKVNSSF
ncbi:MULTISPECIES: Flp pilus assembly protein CpaB [Pseudoalteromonas]|uniref:Flp pilus assembly protein CpaB n=1 Tax=Pseudoalteromonas spongiae TaxID=298657 RepID=A0ABU8ER27_9GAMM|nr:MULTISPECIES: Flp pilus assembly protein CpaB [Pseudoalteromonas]